MKRVGLFALLLFLSSAFSSCKDEYVCNCSDGSTYVGEHSDQSDAEGWCSSKEGPKVTCELSEK